MRENLRQSLLLGSGYVTFFVFAFAISAYLAFPYDRLRDFIVDKANGEGGKNPNASALRIGELAPSWFTGVHLQDVELIRPATEPDAAPGALRLDALTLRASPFAVLFGDMSASFDAEIGEGNLAGSATTDGDSRHIEAELDAVDLHALGLGSWLAVPLQGSASGTIDLTLDKDPKKTQGTVSLSIDKLRVADGKAKIKAPGMPAGVTIDAIEVGKLELEVEVKDGEATVTRFTSSGPDLKVDGTGTARLAEPIARTRLDLALDFKFSDAYKQKSDRTRSLFELLAMQGDWRRATDADGTMHLQVSGSPQALRALPGAAPRTRAAGARRGAARSKSNKASAPAAKP